MSWIDESRRLLYCLSPTSADRPSRQSTPRYLCVI